MPTLLHSSNREVDPAIRPPFSASTLGTLAAIKDASEPGEPLIKVYFKYPLNQRFPGSLNILRTNRLNLHAIRFSQMNVEHHQNAITE